MEAESVALHCMLGGGGRFFMNMKGNDVTECFEKQNVSPIVTHKHQWYEFFKYYGGTPNVSLKCPPKAKIRVHFVAFSLGLSRGERRAMEPQVHHGPPPPPTTTPPTLSCQHVLPFNLRATRQWTHTLLGAVHTPSWPPMFSRSGMDTPHRGDAAKGERVSRVFPSTGARYWGSTPQRQQPNL